MRKVFFKLISFISVFSLIISVGGCTKGSNEKLNNPGNESDNNDNIEVLEKKLVASTELGSVYEYNKGLADVVLNIDASKEIHDVSDLLYGIFFEDINFAADGGLYAEMVQNRSFEFSKLGIDDEMQAWKILNGVNTKVVKDDYEGALNVNNPNYILIENTGDTNGGISNTGFLDGMSIKEGSVYNFSFWCKAINGFRGKVTAAISFNGNPVASTEIEITSDDWKKYSGTLSSSKTASFGVTFDVTLPKGSVALDMISLFPGDTYKNRDNGLRTDLAEKLEALHPSFLRFPGGCVIEGVSLDKAYNWKDSIGCTSDGEPYLFNGTYGDVAARKMGQNIWTNENTTNDKYPSFMTYGLGFYEFFLLSEDIGAIGVPVLNCGMCCQGQSTGAGPGIGTPEFERYIQDALDLVEFCKGDVNSKWGKVRAAMGHPEPFSLIYIGIGNEQWDNSYYNRYDEFVKAFRKAAEKDPELYGDIKLMYSAGTDDGDSGKLYKKAYQHASDYIKKNPDISLDEYAAAIDHHYYNTPDWFLSHTDYYDEKNYTRDKVNFLEPDYQGGINVFLGEYAAKSNNLKAALSEAAYMTGLERNSDIVKMAAYAPLFGNLTATHWAPDLIWFNNKVSTASVNYFVQQIFAKNVGTKVLQSEMNETKDPGFDLKGKVGVATWQTSAKFDNIRITNTDTGEVLAAEDFETEDSIRNWQMISDGNWAITDGWLVQSNKDTDVNKFANTGAAAYFGDVNWTNYTYELDAVKLSGKEGFLIPFGVKDSKNNFFWNIGGWTNTTSSIQKVASNVKSDQIKGTYKQCKIKTNETYKIKVVVSGSVVECYLNDELYCKLDTATIRTYDCYEVVSTDDSGDIIIKMVNVSGNPKTFAINIDGAEKIGTNAVIDSVAGDSLSNDNILGQKEDVILKSGEIEGITNRFNFEVPMYSVTVLRVKRQ